MHRRLKLPANRQRRREPNARHPEQRSSLPTPAINPPADNPVSTTPFTFRCDLPSRSTVCLPPELLIMVASHLDASGLLKFSRMCRDWREFARPFVFHSLVIRSVAREMELSNFFVAHPDQAKCVRSLKYFGPQYQKHVPKEPEAWKSWFEDRPKLYGLLPNLVALSVQCFQGLTNVSHASFLQELGRGFSSVKKLAVGSCSGHPRAFTAFISSFGNLQALSLTMIEALRGSTMDQAQEQAAGAPCDLSRLTTLDIEYTIGLEHVFSHFKPLQSLRNLRLCWLFRTAPLPVDGPTQGYVDILSQDNLRIDSLTLCFTIPPLRLLESKGAVTQTTASLSRAFELPSLRAMHTLAFGAVPVCSVSTMLKRLATGKNNLRRVRIVLADNDKRVFGAGEDGCQDKETEGHFDSIDQVLSRREFLDRGLQVEVINCFYDREEGDGSELGMREAPVNLSEFMFPSLFRAKALVFPEILKGQCMKSR